MPCLILRAVSDLVDPARGEVYDDYAEFERRSLEVMGALLRRAAGLARGLVGPPDGLGDRATRRPVCF